MTTSVPVQSVPVCRLCGCNYGELVSREVAGTTGSAVYRCKGCTLTYLFPIMTEEEEAAFYQCEFETYMSGRWQAGWESPQVHFREFQPEGERRLPLIRPHLRAEDSVLEIGSSTGYFLEDLRGYVLSVMGVEPSEAYRTFAIARGIETVATLDDLGSRKFDVITMYYVLEHLRDPVGYLVKLRTRLKPGGKLVLEVPNVEDALLSCYRIPQFKRFYWQKAHYHYFSRQTLGNVLVRAGYEAKLFPVQRYDLSNHMVWMMEGKPGGMRRFAELFTPELDIAYAEALKEHWICDTLLAVGTIKA